MEQFVEPAETQRQFADVIWEETRTRVAHLRINTEDDGYDDDDDDDSPYG